MTMKTPRAAAFSAVLLLAAFAGLPARADSANDIIGRWRDSDGESEIAISRCGQALCGKIVWLKQARTDGANPDPALRGRSLLGIQVLSGFRPHSSPGVLAGQGYNPEDGKLYRTTLTLRSHEALVIKGCVLGGLVCDDDVWTRQR